jgi:hypothetical protein
MEPSDWTAFLFTNDSELLSALGAGKMSDRWMRA